MIKQTYLVTGGSGFLGYSLVKRLIPKSKKIFVFDNNFRGSFKKFNNNEKKKLQFIKGDIRKKSNLEKIIKKTDVVYHLAFINGTKHFYQNPKLVLDVGIKGTMNVLEIIRDSKNVRKFFYASSSEVYNQPKKIPTDEKAEILIPDPRNSRFSYGGAKAIGEILTYNYLKDTSTKFCIFRPHNLFGPEMGFEHVIPDVIKKIIYKSKRLTKNNCHIEIQGTGAETRAFCFIEDAIDQLEIIEKNFKNKEIYHVGQQHEITIKKLVQLISSYIGVKVKIRNKKLLKGSALRRCPKISKIKKIGYKKKNNFLFGLHTTIDWYKNYFL